MSDQRPEPGLVHLPVSFFGAVQRALLADHEPAEAARILRGIGLESGSALYDQFVAFLNRGNGPPPDSLEEHEFWSRLRSFFDELGWGSLDQQRLHPGVLELSSRNWGESADAGASHVGCQITTGILADLLRRTAGSDVSVLEVECRGKGAERCSFLVGNEATLGMVFDRVRTGDPYGEAVAALT